jgi:hypothetical protein
MNNAVDGANLTSLFTSLASSFEPGSALDAGDGLSQPIEFMDILSGQTRLSEVLSQLRELLPEEQFSAVAALFEGGNGLPLTAEIAGELPTVANPEVVQALFARLGLSPGLEGRVGSAAGTRPGVALEGGRSPRAAIGRGIVEGNLAPTSVGSAVVESSAKVLTPMLDTVPELLPAKPLLDLIPAEVQPPLAGLLPKVVSSGQSAGPLDWDPSLEFNPIAGVEGRTGPEPMTLSRAFAQPLLELNAPLGKSSWDQGLGERVLWLVGRSIQGASIRINPPHLGPIDIQLTLQNDQANVSFGAQHGVVREALEAAIPRLREMFGENNLQLVNVDVGERNSGDPRPQRGNGEGSTDSGNGAFAESRDQRSERLEEDPMVVDSTRYYGSDGLLDDYA